MKRIISGLLLTTMIANTAVHAAETIVARDIEGDVSFLTLSVPVVPDKEALSLGKFTPVEQGASLEESSWIFMDDSETIRKENATKPLVQLHTDGSKHINGNYMELQETIHIMNDLSYAFAKRQSKSDELNKWVAAYNKNESNFSSFKASLEDDFGVGCVDFFDILEELDYLDRKAFIKARIESLEASIESNIERAEKHLKVLEESGWELKVIEGHTGYKSITGSHRAYVPDDRGFVAYHRPTNTIVVTYHGSRCDADWDTNFDGMKVRASEVGLDLPGDAYLHRGFGNAVKSCEQQVKDAIRFFVRQHEQNGGDRKDLNIFVTGHSQGAALAQISLLVLCINFGRELFGTDYKNAEKNNFKGIFFSAPRAFGGESIECLNHEVGKDNMIRQNVHGDIVPIISLKKAEGAVKDFLQALKNEDFKDYKVLKFLGLDKKIIEFVKKKPQLAAVFNDSFEKVVEKFSGFDNVGHLALDNVMEAQKRVWWSSVKALGNRTLTNFMDVAGNSIWRVLGYKIQGPGIMSFIANTAKDILLTLLAPLHYGSLQDEAGGAFNPDVVGKNPDALLAAGLAHEKAKAGPQPGPIQPKNTTTSSVLGKFKGWFRKK